MKDRSELIGQRFNHLTIIDPIAERRGNHWRALCRCSCGNKELKNLHSVLRGATKSCGCMTKEMLATNKSTHGLSKSNYLYTTFYGIKSRCYRPTSKGFANYGGAGIKMHHLWVNDVRAFCDYILSTLGERPSPKHTLDRIDRAGDYAPSNLRWASPAEQARNKRDNVWLSLDGETLILSDMARKLGVNARSLATCVQLLPILKRMERVSQPRPVYRINPLR